MDPPDTFLETGTVWTVWKSLNRTFLCQEKKKKKLGQVHRFLWGKTETLVGFYARKMPFGKSV